MTTCRFCLDVHRRLHRNYRINDLTFAVMVTEVRRSQAKLSIDVSPEVVVLRDALVVDDAE